MQESLDPRRIVVTEELFLHGLQPFSVYARSQLTKGSYSLTLFPPPE